MYSIMTMGLLLLKTYLKNPSMNLLKRGPKTATPAFLGSRTRNVPDVLRGSFYNELPDHSNDSFCVRINTDEKINDRANAQYGHKQVNHALIEHRAEFASSAPRCKCNQYGTRLN